MTLHLIGAGLPRTGTSSLHVNCVLPIPDTPELLAYRNSAEMWRSVLGQPFYPLPTWGKRLSGPQKRD